MLVDRFRAGQKWYQGLTVVPGVKDNTSDLLAASFAINILSLAIPLTLMQVYDRIIPYEALNTLAWLAMVAAAALVLEGVLRLLRAQASAWTAARFEHLVGMSMVEKVLTTRLSEFERFGLGEHLDRMNAVSTLRSFYAGQVFQVMLDVPFALMFIVAVWYLGGWLVMLPLSMIVLYFLVVRLIKARFESARKNQVVVNDRRFNYVIELLGGVHLLKAQAMEEQMLRRYERLQGATAESNMDVGYWSGLPAAIGGVFSLVTMFGVIAFGGKMVIDGGLTMGGLAACMLLAGRALQPIQSAAGFWVRFSNADIARQRLADIADSETEVPEDTPQFPQDVDGWVRLRNVVFRYGDEQEYLADDIDLIVEPKEMYGFLGKSSSGTSTVMHMIMGRTKPNSGHVFIDDYNISEWDASHLSGRIEYVPQNATLFKGTILENITLFNTKHHEAAMDAAGLMGLDDFAALLPQGYETKVDAQAANFLPSGLIQRICIARSLVVRPRILIFDKTDSSMDRDTLEQFRWLLEHLKGTVTVLLVSNEPSLLRQCDRVFELFYGKLVEKKPDNTDERVEDLTDLFDSFDAPSDTPSDGAVQ